MAGHIIGGQLADTIEYRRFRVGEIVDDHRREASGVQLDDRVGTDVSSPPGNDHLLALLNHVSPCLCREPV